VSSESVTPKEWHLNAFFQELMVPNGGDYYGGWLLPAKSQIAVGLSVHHASEPEGSELAVRAGRASIRAARLGEGITADEMLRTIVDHEGIACLMLDEGLHVLAPSAVAASLLRDGTLLGLTREGYLRLPDEAATRRLRPLIAAACRRESGGVQRIEAADGQVAFLRVVPAEQSNLALVFVRFPRPLRLADPAVIAGAFRCTAAESEVAVALALGATPQAVAKARGTSIHTVRAQIRALLAASGCPNVAALVAAVARL
jgi:DNA-binding CsgD family transcriptional regulator